MTIANPNAGGWVFDVEGAQLTVERPGPDGMVLIDVVPTGDLFAPNASGVAWVTDDPAKLDRLIETLQHVRGLMVGRDVALWAEVASARERYVKLVVEAARERAGASEVGES